MRTAPAGLLGDALQDGVSVAAAVGECHENQKVTGRDGLGGCSGSHQGAPGDS